MTFQFAFRDLPPIAYLILFLIVAVFVAAIIASFIIRSKYKKLHEDLSHPRSGKFKSDLLNDIVSDYKSAAINNFSGVNTQAIIEKHFDSTLVSLQIAERFVRSSVSMLIVFGLLGTFIGLTLAVGELFSMIIGIDAEQIIEMFRSIGTSLLTSLKGMSTAFTTSLFGIAFSVILTIINIIFNVEQSREALMVNIEEFLDNTLSLVVSKNKESEYSFLNRTLKDTFIEFGEKIENSLLKTAESFGDQLKGVVMEVNLSSKALDYTVDRFDRALKNFAENIKDFSDFNINLRNNIEIMDVSFIKATEALNDASKTIINNYNTIENFSDDLQAAINGITAHNNRVISDMEILIEKVKETIVDIKELGQVIKSSINQNGAVMEAQRDNLNRLMVKVGEEINLLADNTSEAFSKKLSETGKSIAVQLSEEIKQLLSEIHDVLQAFGENERMLSKTISILPDQFLTYSEAAAARIDKQMSEITKALKKN